MDYNVLIALLGVAVILIVLIDVFITVLHVDSDGPVARAVFHLIWRLVIRFVKAFPTTRRPLVALAGPVMLAAAVVVWIGMFIYGFALVYWPFIDLFRAEEEYLFLGFTQALYFSGVTATVLGYGDITPNHGLLQVLSFVQSGMGFALLTGIITYLIHVISGVSERNALSLRLWAVTGKTGEGAEAVIRSLSYENIADLRLRLQTLLDSLHSIHQKMHQFPILDLFYRSRIAIYSPELMIRSSMQLAIAVQIISADQKHRSLKPVSEELGQIATEIMGIIAAQHMSDELENKLNNPDPSDADRNLLEQIRNKLTNAFPLLKLHEGEDEQVLLMICRMRVFMDEADNLTGWRMDEIL